MIYSLSSVQYVGAWIKGTGCIPLDHKVHIKYSSLRMDHDRSSPLGVVGLLKS